MSELKAMSDAATPGEWHMDTHPSHDGESGEEERSICDGICTHDDSAGIAEGVATCAELDARFVVALVNAYRTGRLVETLA